MKVLWITNIPSPYRIDFFNELGNLCNLTVVFERQKATNRDKSWGEFNTDTFRSIFLKGLSVTRETSLGLGVAKHIKKHKYEQIVVSNSFTATGVLAILILKLRNMNFIIEGDGGFIHRGSKIKKFIKKVILKNASLYLSTGKSHDEYYLSYDVPKDKIIRYPFTSIREGDILVKPPTQEEKKILRVKKNIDEKYIILFVGQIIDRKGIDVLLKSIEYLEEDVGVYLVGGQAHEKYLKLISINSQKKIYFVKFLKHNDLRDYYKFADIFVLPTRHDTWGLVVNEAMAYGLPVITTFCCGSGIELINDYQNGFLIECDNEVILSKRIETLLNDYKLRKKISNNNIELSKNYTIEKMAKIHYDILIANNKKLNE